MVVGVSETRKKPPRNRDRLRWWKKKEQMLPILAGAARKIRNRMKSSKVEHLVVSDENRTKIGEFLKRITL